MSDTADLETANDEMRADTVSVYGDFAKQLSVIHSANVSLMVGAGRLPDDRRVLVPYVEVEFGGTFGREDIELVLSTTLTLENATFLLRRLSEGLKGATETLFSLSQGSMKADPERLVFAQANLVIACQSLREAGDDLKGLTAA